MTNLATGFTQAERERLLSVLRTHKPKKAWLFGSRARGEGREDSDVDLLIVDERTGGRDGIEIDISVELMPRLWHLDLLAVSPEFLEAERKNSESFISQILAGAELLYEQD